MNNDESKLQDEYELNMLLALAIEQVMTEEQLAAQRISFAYGNVSLSNPSVTKEMVKRAADQIYGTGHDNEA